jgi:hypothetical protein
LKSLIEHTLNGATDKLRPVERQHDHAHTRPAVMGVPFSLTRV